MGRRRRLWLRIGTFFIIDGTCSVPCPAVVTTMSSEVVQILNLT